VYDGPFCILSVVDNRRYKRLLYEVLDHDPTHDDIRAFLKRLHTAILILAWPWIRACAWRSTALKVGLPLTTRSPRCPSP